MATFDDLYPDILPSVPGCPIAVVQQHLRKTLRHFCQESWFWRESLLPISLLEYVEHAKQTFIYSLQSDTAHSVDVLAVNYLIYKGVSLPGGSVSAMDRCSYGWRSQVGNHPRMFLQPEPNKVQFVPASSEVQASAITGSVFVMPAITAIHFGDSLLRFEDAIVAGTLARLQRMTNKEWGDMQAAEINQMIYAEGLSLAKLESARELHTESVATPNTLA